MIGQQLDLFGGPLRPPKKILVDEPSTEEQAVSPEVSEPAKEPDPIKEDLAEETRPVLSGDVVASDIATETTIEENPIDEFYDDEETESISEEALPEVTGAEQLDEEETEQADFGDVSFEVPAAAATVHERKAKPENGEQQQVVYRGRKTGDPDEEMEMLNVPPDEELFKRQYYSMREAAAMFNVNQALLRFWENEFDILQPKKNKKGDRYFRPIDIKNLVLIYHLLRVRKFTMDGAKDYLQTHQKAADSFQLVQRLEKLKSFLLELKANL